MNNIKRWLSDPVWGISSRFIVNCNCWFPLKRNILDRIQYWHIRKQNKLDRICLSHWHLDYNPQPIIDVEKRKIPNWMIYDDWKTSV